jgi:peptide/nickel transport system permease protein
MQTAPSPPSAPVAAAPAAPRARPWTSLLGLALAWALVVAILYLSLDQFRSIGRGERTGIDVYVAIATLALLVIGDAWWTLRMVRRSSRAALPRGDSQWSIASRHFRRNKLAMAGLIVMILLYVITLVTPLVAPYDPAAQGDIVTMRNLAPSWAHLMGTDKFGRDIFSRVLYGSRISLTIGFIAVGISISLGTLVGALAGYFGGWVDTVLMRFTDMMLSFPRLVLLIVVIALFSPSIWLVVAVLGLTGWMGTARLVRGEVLSLREREFIQAARALGMGDGRIIFRHIIPNTIAPVIVSATLGIGQTILTEASLSFLGLGVQPPTPSWGNMVADGRDALQDAWWIATAPGIAIVVTVIAFNLLGDGLRDALDPRLRT